MLLAELFLVLLAQVHNCAHVDLVEGREHRRGLLGLDESRRDRLTHGAHAFLLGLTHHASGRRSGCGTCGTVLMGLNPGEHILLADATRGSCAGDLLEIDALIVSELACQRGRLRF